MGACPTDWQGVDNVENTVGSAEGSHRLVWVEKPAVGRRARERDHRRTPRKFGLQEVKKEVVMKSTEGWQRGRAQMIQDSFASAH